jgi:hypothetical protein
MGCDGPCSAMRSCQKKVYFWKVQDRVRQEPRSTNPLWTHVQSESSLRLCNLHLALRRDRSDILVSS